MDEKPRPGRELRKVRVDMKHVNSIDFGGVFQHCGHLMSVEKIFSELCTNISERNKVTSYKTVSAS